MPWEQLTSAPVTLRRPVGGAIGGKIYTVDDAVTYEYDPNLDSWTLKAAFPVTGVIGMQGAVRSGLLHVQDFYDSNEFRTYDPVGNSWATITDSGSTGTSARYSWMAVDDSGNLYNGGGQSNDVNRWDGASWSNALTTMPDAFIAECRAAEDAGGNIYIVGGLDGATGTARVLKYTPPGTWTTVAPYADPACGATVVSADQWIYVIGGAYFDAFDTYELDRVVRYNPTTDEWRVMSSLPVAASYMGGAYIDPYLYAWGGETGGGLTEFDTMYRLLVEADPEDSGLDPQAGSFMQVRAL